jgi:hypothetical protein
VAAILAVGCLDYEGNHSMRTFWFVAACVVISVMAIWYSRTTYAEPPNKVPEGQRMIALEGAVVDASQILFVEEKGKAEGKGAFHIAFRGLPYQANSGAFSDLMVKNTSENRKRLAEATGVVLRPPAADKEQGAEAAKK